MREIKFRAWDKKNKVMSKPFTLFDLIEARALNLTPSETLESYIIMQDTGLKDKNDNRIWEGDIVHLKDISGSGRERDFGNKAVKWKSVGFSESLLTENIEVIGNIYENPELLEK